MEVLVRVHITGSSTPTVKVYPLAIRKSRDNRRQGGERGSGPPGGGGGWGGGGWGGRGAGRGGYALGSTQNGLMRWIFLRMLSRSRLSLAAARRALSLRIFCWRW